MASSGILIDVLFLIRFAFIFNKTPLWLQARKNVLERAQNAQMHRGAGAPGSACCKQTELAVTPRGCFQRTSLRT